MDLNARLPHSGIAQWGSSMTHAVTSQGLTVSWSTASLDLSLSPAVWGPGPAVQPPARLDLSSKSWIAVDCSLYTLAVTLQVLDEVHHVNDETDHPYTNIMRLYQGTKPQVGPGTCYSTPTRRHHDRLCHMIERVCVNTARPNLKVQFA